jgi:hypothetical protein
MAHIKRDTSGGVFFCFSFVSMNSKEKHSKQISQNYISITLLSRNANMDGYRQFTEKGGR